MINNEEKLNEADYIQRFSKAFCEIMDKIAETEVTTVTKVNETKQGIIIKYPDSKISPTIYPADVFREHVEGETPEKAAERCAKEMINLRKETPEFEGLDFSPEGAKKNLYCTVINAEANKEFLKDTPHIIKDDLAVIARYRVAPEASFIVHNNHSEAFKMTSDEIMETAMKNTEAQVFKVRGIEDVLREMMGVTQDEFMDELLAGTPKSPFYVVSNEMNVDGAIAIVSKSAMEQVHDTIGEDFYILPSSRHEILAVPESMATDPEDLKHMVEEVNANEVSISDKLSDNIYHYDSLAKKVSMVDIQKLDKTNEMSEMMTKTSARAM